MANPSSPISLASAVVGSWIALCEKRLERTAHRYRGFLSAADQQQDHAIFNGSKPRFEGPWPQAAVGSQIEPKAEGLKIPGQRSLAGPQDLQAMIAGVVDTEESAFLLSASSGKTGPRPPASMAQWSSPLSTIEAVDRENRKARWTRVSRKEGTTLNRGMPPLHTKPKPDLNLYQGICLPAPQNGWGKKPSESSAAFQIQIRLLSGKTMLQWVCQTDPVWNLKHALDIKLGIPSADQRLLYQGKHLEDLLPISFYGIEKDASIILSLRLRGGAGGEPSSAKGFSYKDAVHGKQAEKTEPPIQTSPKAFLVDKLEEIPSVEISYPDLEDDTQKFAERAIICRFNGLWPRSQDLYDWIKATWTDRCKVYFCAKEYFIVLFEDLEHCYNALDEGPWFMGSAGLFLTPWFPDFDPASAVITKAPVWIRLPNLPVHLWRTEVYRQIGNALGRFWMGDYQRERQGLYTYARVCVELDLSKGLPEYINLKIKDAIWTQFIEYENTAFRCRHCHQTGHLHISCPSLSTKAKKGLSAHTKPKRWAPCPPPPTRSSSPPSMKKVPSMEKEENQSEPDQIPQTMDPPTNFMEHTHVSANSQKRPHETSSSDSEKEFPMIENSSLQVVVAHPPHEGWTHVNKKKGKKQCGVITVPLG